jgi:hypothetical protein
MSIAPSGASTGNMRARIAPTAPTISSTVSPRTRSAIRKPPICDGVAAPDMMISKAARASSRLSASRAATLATNGFKSLMSSLLRRHRCASAVSASDWLIETP